MRIIILLLSCVTFTANAKLLQPLNHMPSEQLPASLHVNFKSTQEESTLKLPPPNLSTLKVLNNAQLKHARFAIKHPSSTLYNLAGKWQTIGDQAIWKLEINAEDTYSLNVGFKNVFLPNGAKLFIYSADGSQATVFTHEDNNHAKQIWSPVFDTNHIYVEINVPVALQNYLSFDFTHINQGFKDYKNIFKSGICNIDVACSASAEWENEIRSVTRYTITVGSDNFFCTGTLVNNSNADNTPYILTADHCGVSAVTAPSMVFNWNFETSACSGIANGSEAIFNSGATFRAGWTESSPSNGSDFALVEMTSAPPVAANAVFAGWDNNNTTPSSVVGIHHPSGDEKRISFANGSLSITNEGSNVANASGKYLRIAAWDGGTTEQGSSGSAIWNSDHRIVGTLTSGISACAGTVNNGEPDWYGRMASHWEGGGTASTRLKDWLDPANGGTLNALDANVANCNRPSASIAINSSPTTINTNVGFSVAPTGGAGGYTYAWDFDGDNVTDSTEQNPSFTYTSRYSGIVTLNVTDSAACTTSLVSGMIVQLNNNSSTTTTSGGGALGIFMLPLLLLSLFTRRAKL